MNSSDTVSAGNRDRTSSAVSASESRGTWSSSTTRSRINSRNVTANGRSWAESRDDVRELRPTGAKVDLQLVGSRRQRRGDRISEREVGDRRVLLETPA